MKLNKEAVLSFHVLLLFILLMCLVIHFSNAAPNKNDEPEDNEGGKDTFQKPTSNNPYQKKMCVPGDDTIRARRRVCLLRADTGPCRADIVSWYYDARKHRCFRFFWGGCQGNGNNFRSREECEAECYLTTNMEPNHLPHYCGLAFDFGTCYGHYNRWAWDKFSKTCKRRLYSGCGGNQNNFETLKECMANCLVKPNNTLNVQQNVYTTCIPFKIDDFN